jgi:hypothetical protein
MFGHFLVKTRQVLVASHCQRNWHSEHMSVATFFNGVNQFAEGTRQFVDGVDKVATWLNGAIKVIGEVDRAFTDLYSPPVAEKSAVARLVPATTTPPPASLVSLSHRISLLGGNTFLYKRKVLRGFSRSSKHGKLLEILLAAEHNLVEDVDLLRELNVSDARGLSFVLRNLRCKFRNNGLSITIEDRKDPDSYVLVGICKG